MPAIDTSYFFDLSKYKHAKLFEGCKYPWEALKNIERYLATFKLGKIEIDIPSNVFLEDIEKISIGKGTVIEQGAYIRGPCIIGENCVIRHGAYIRGNLITGDNCVIGHTTEVKNTIFLDHVAAAHFAYLGDTILGNHVNLGAGTKCANLKLDHSSIHVCVNDAKMDSGLRKFGALIGDKSQLGCNSVTNPGTLLGKEVMCYPCVNIGGFVPSQSQVKSANKMIISPLTH